MPRLSSARDDTYSVHSGGSGSQQRRSWSSAKEGRTGSANRTHVDIDVRERDSSKGSARGSARGGEREGSVISESAASQSSAGSWMRRGEPRDTHQTEGHTQTWGLSFDLIFSDLRKGAHSLHFFGALPPEPRTNRL
jgi:hypothetical protein